MKHFLIVILVCLTVSSFFNRSYSWDPEAAKFYPLAVGNQWSYHFISRGGNPVPCYPHSPYNYIITITGDTVINGHKYYKFSNGDRLRIDSTSMNVYRFLGAGECLIDSLLTKKNNMVYSCELAGMVSDTNLVNFAGENRRSFNISGIGYSKRLMYGIGIYFLGGCELNSGFDRQLNGCIINGVQYGVMLGVNNISNELPAQFSLSQNYPNPFNPVTKISFQIPLSRGVDAVGGRGVLTLLKIYSALGREVQVLINQSVQPGTYEVDWDASNYPSGIYFYELTSGDFIQTKKMVLVK